MEMRLNVQATRQDGKKLSFDSPNPLFVGESAGLHVSGLTNLRLEKRMIIQNVSWALSRFTVPLLPGGHTELGELIA
jgi:hypothetical protein